MAAVVPQTSPENPPNYDDVIMENSDDTVRREGSANDGFEEDMNAIKISVDSPRAGSSVRDKLSANNEKHRTEKDDDVDTVTEQEKKMLSTLRELVQRCTQSNPLKRPSAADLLQMFDKPGFSVSPDGHKHLAYTRSSKCASLASLDVSVFRESTTETSSVN